MSRRSDLWTSSLPAKNMLISFNLRMKLKGRVLSVTGLFAEATVFLLRKLPAGLQDVQHAEAFLHERTQSFGADQAAVTVDQALSAALDGDTRVLHEEVTHILIEQLAGRLHLRRL